VVAREQVEQVMVLPVEAFLGVVGELVMALLVLRVELEEEAVVVLILPLVFRELVATV
jgi:hypothetical protein